MLINENEIKLLKVASADNTSDLGAKRLAIQLFIKIISQIIDKAIYTNIKQKLELKKKVKPQRLTRQQIKFFMTTILW